MLVLWKSTLMQKLMFLFHMPSLLQTSCRQEFSLLNPYAKIFSPNYLNALNKIALKRLNDQGNELFVTICNSGNGKHLRCGF